MRESVRKILGSLAVITLVLCLAAAPATGASQGFDKKAYDKIAKRTIGRIISGNVDPDRMISDMKELMAMGVQGCREYMNSKGTSPKEAKLMQLVVDNAEKMPSLTEEEIEEQWHDGGLARSIGIDISSLSRFSKVMCHYGSVVHPATVIILLEHYKKTHDENLLEQAKAELVEIREHLKYL